MNITISTTQDAIQDSLWSRLRSAQSVEDVMELVREVSATEESYSPLWEAGTPSAEAIAFDDNVHPRRFRVQAARILRDLMGDNFEQGRELVFTYLLPSCLRWIDSDTSRSRNTTNDDGTRVIRPSRADEASWEATEMREELVKWLDSLPEEHRETLENEVLAHLCQRGLQLADDPQMPVEEVRAVCWTLNTLGQRTPEVENALLRLIQTRNDLGGDCALSILASMGGVPDVRRDGAQTSNLADQTKRTAFLAQLRARIEARPSRFLGYVLCRIASAELLNDALNLFHSQSPDISYYTGKSYHQPPDAQSRESNQSMKRTLLAQFAGVLPDEAEVQHIVWRELYQDCQGTSEGRNDLLFQSNLVRWCNSPELVPNMTALLRREMEQEHQDEQKNPLNESNQEKEEKGPPQHWTVYIAASRLQDAIRPRHLEGWRLLSPAELEPFHVIAQTDSGQTGYHMTSPMRAKKSAWETLILANMTFSAQDVQLAVKNERSLFVQGDIMETIAPLGCDPLPPVVLELLAQKHDLNSEDGDTSAFAACRGAETLARATANREAFHALLNFGFLYRGEVLRSTSDSLDDVAVFLASKGDGQVVSDLFDATTPANPLNRRIVAVSALLALASQQLLPAARWRELLALARNSGLEDFYASFAVQAVGLLEDAVAQSDACDELIALWRESRNNAAGNFSNIENRAHEALARHGTWRHKVSDAEFLSPLRLVLQDEEWRLENGVKLDSDIMRTLALLYRSEPGKFGRAIADALERFDDEAHYGLTRYLCAPDQTGQSCLSLDLAQIMLRQLLEQESSQKSRPYLFQALAVAAPALLLEARWREVWNSWRTDARVALADALGLAIEKHQSTAALDDEQHANVTAHLEELLRDRFYAVRRAACRALSLLGTETLQSIALFLASSDNVQERCRGAEAAFWLQDDVLFENGSTLRSQMRYDRERTVRQAVERVAVDHQERHWADEYLKRVLTIMSSPYSIGEVLPYGAALARLGDDSHLHRLNVERERPDLAPRVRIWLKEICSSLETQWNDKTQKWPEPWLNWEGVVEELNGELWQRDTSLPVVARFWRRPRVGARGTSSWGGLLLPTGTASSRMIKTGEATLRLEGRSEGQLLIHQSLTSSQDGSASSWALFSGQGAYPTLT